MADVKVSDLTEISSASTDDLLAIVDDPAGTPLSRAISVDNLQKSLTKVGKVTLTQPATASTLTVADGKVLTVNNTLTFNGTDATTMTFPNSSSTVVGDTNTQTLTNKTIDADNNTLSNIATGALKTKTGADGSVVTGTAGTSGNLAEWNADGDAVDSGLATANVIDTSDTASTTASGIVELATSTETTTGTDATRAVTPDGLAGSNYGKRFLSFGLVESDTAVAVADGTVGVPITAELNGWNIVGVQANVYTKGITGTTDIQVRRQRGATDADVLSTKVTIGDEYFAADGTINTSNDDIATGDMIFVDIDAVHSGTAPNGLSVVVIVQLP